MRSQAAAVARRSGYRATWSYAMRGWTWFYLGWLIFIPIVILALTGLREGWRLMLSELWRPEARSAVLLTVYMSLIVVAIDLVVGTVTAFVLVRRQFPGRTLLNSLVDLPFAVPTVVTGVMLVALLGPAGPIGGILSGHGIEVMFAKPGIILALLFVTFPFVVRAVQPVLEQADIEAEMAAKTLGASSWTTFLRVTLPTILPAVLTGGTLSFARALGEFGSVVVVAGNIPFVSQVAAVYVYGQVESYNPAGATAVSLELMLLALLMLFLFRVLQSRARGGDRVD
jgi:sulfate transport system permease protein